MTKTTKTAVSEPAEYLIFAAATKNMPVFAKNTERKHLQKPKKFRLKAIQKNCILKTSVSQQQRRKEENLVKRAKEECEKIESELTEIDRRLSGNEACDYTIVSELCSKKDTLEERLMELYEIIMKD